MFLIKSLTVHKQRGIELLDLFSKNIQTIVSDIVADTLALKNDMFRYIFRNETEVCTGLVERDGIDKNIRLIFEIQPETQRVCIVFLDVLLNAFPFGLRVMVNLPVILRPRFFEDRIDW